LWPQGIYKKDAQLERRNTFSLTSLIRDVIKRTPIVEAIPSEASYDIAIENKREEVDDEVVVADEDLAERGLTRGPGPSRRSITLHKGNGKREDDEDEDNEDADDEEINGEVDMIEELADTSERRGLNRHGNGGSKRGLNRHVSGGSKRGLNRHGNGGSKRGLSRPGNGGSWVQMYWVAGPNRFFVVMSF
jgi:hypothetical protein